MLDVHLYGEVNGQWPEGQRPNQTQEVVEEWEYHGYHSSDDNICSPPHHSERIYVVCSVKRHIHGVFFSDELAIRPFLTTPALYEPKYGLAEDLAIRNRLHDCTVITSKKRSSWIGFVNCLPGMLRLSAQQ